jgi:hypothetical protein
MLVVATEEEDNEMDAPTADLVGKILHKVWAKRVNNNGETIVANIQSGSVEGL